MHCGDEFGLEFYWNGALNPSLREGVTSNPSMKLLLFLREETQKAINRLQGNLNVVFIASFYSEIFF